MHAMSIIDDALKANRNYARGHDRKLAQRPAPKIAVVTCMDPPLSNLPAILGLPQADIDVIRTGGPAATDDVLGELIVSNRVFVFDMETGFLREVAALLGQTAA
jgi:carbonic anhydrase